MMQVTLFILAAMGFTLAMIFVCSRGSRRKVVPVVVSPDVARRHVPVICLVRGVEGIIVVPVLVLVGLIVVGFLIQINPFDPKQNSNVYFSVTMLGLVLLVGAAIIAKTVNRIRKADRPRFPNFWRVDTNSVSFFAFVFAAFAAHDLYQLMPAWKPEPRLPLALHFLNRDFLWIICFFVVRGYANRALSRILELNPKAPPQNPEPPDESDSGPYVPFDPYNLPNNPPLRPSGGS